MQVYLCTYNNSKLYHLRFSCKLQIFGCHKMAEILTQLLKVVEISFWAQNDRNMWVYNMHTSYNNSKLYDLRFSRKSWKTFEIHNSAPALLKVVETSYFRAQNNWKSQYACLFIYTISKHAKICFWYFASEVHLAKLVNLWFKMTPGL